MSDGDIHFDVNVENDENQTPIEMNFGMENNAAPTVEVDGDNFGQEFGNYTEDDEDFDAPIPDEQSEPEEDPTDEHVQQLRAMYLSEVRRYQSIPGIKIDRIPDMSWSVKELRSLAQQLKVQVEMKNSLKFSKMALMTCVSGLEFLNNRYDPLSLPLDGWANQVWSEIDTYDEVLQELYIKYRSTIHVSPELKLVMMLMGSMFSYTVGRMNPGLGAFVNKATGSFTGTKSEESTKQKPMSGPSFTTEELTKPVKRSEKRKNKKKNDTDLAFENLGI